MTNKEVKEMVKYFAAVSDNHRAAKRMESAYEAGMKRANCEQELMRRAAK